MLRQIPRWLPYAALGCALGAAATLLLPDSPALRLLAPLAVGPLAAGLTYAVVRWRLRRQLRGVGDLVLVLLNNPAQGVLDQGRRELGDGELVPLWGHVETLAAAYRKALQEVVDAREQLDRLTAVHGVGVGDESSRPPPVVPTHFVVGSSRHRMVARLAPNLNVINSTQPLRQFLDRPSRDLHARSFLTVLHPHDAEAFQHALREALRDGECHNLTICVLPPPAKDARKPAAWAERYLHMDIMTCYDEHGTPTDFRCHFQDVTDRVLAEREVSLANAELRETNDMLQRLKESYFDLYHYAPVLYFSLDPAMNFVAFNETMLRILGYPREALIGRPYATLLPPDRRVEFLADPTPLQQPGECETQWVKQDGSVIDVWIGTTTIRDPDGAFVRSRSAALDVTELHQKADQLSRANLQLRRTNQELEEFTYVVSHDLKEPLRTLEAFSTFLATDYADALAGDGQEYIRHLQQASKRLGQLIDDLLTLSRTGRVIHTPRPFAWATVTRTLLSDLQDLIGRRSAVVRIAEPLPPAMGDPERITQLLANLVSNALKYNRSADPRVVIGAGQPDRGFVTLYVRDNGIGIDKAHHDQIFRIFRRLHHREEFEGTGAGLAICKRIVEAHGGRIWVESEPGNGATFYFTLPAQRSGGDDAADRPREREARDGDRALAPGGR